MLRKYFNFVKNTEFWQSLPIHFYTLVFIELIGEFGRVNYDFFTVTELIKLTYYVTGVASTITTYMIFFYDVKYCVDNFLAGKK